MYVFTHINVNPTNKFCGFSFLVIRTKDLFLFFWLYNECLRDLFVNIEENVEESVN